MVAAVIVWHIGGGDEMIGPITQVCNQFPYTLVTFEALDGTCVSDAIGEATFRVNKHPLSSGLLPTNPAFANEIHNEDGTTWGENTALEREVAVKTTTIDELAKTRPQADVLSIDCQGAELRILRGGAQALKNVLCVVAEVEFEPIYEGQHLFDEQMAFLRPYGFRLMDLCGQQMWQPAPKFGLGFLTVGEAVWLRWDYQNLTPAQVETLAKIAAGFGRLSYAMKLLEHLGGKVTDPTLHGLWHFRDNQDLKLCAERRL